jgi:hypothetical protein
LSVCKPSEVGELSATLRRIGRHDQEERFNPCTSRAIKLTDEMIRFDGRHHQPE